MVGTDGADSGHDFVTSSMALPRTRPSNSRMPSKTSSSTLLTYVSVDNHGDAAVPFYSCEVFY